MTEGGASLDGSIFSMAQEAGTECLLEMRPSFGCKYKDERNMPQLEQIARFLTPVLNTVKMMLKTYVK